MNVQLSGDARARLDTHLDAVERVLMDSGQTREQRRAVVDDLEAQIFEMLAANTPTPGLSDVEAVLSQLDPPSAYAGAKLPQPPAIAPHISSAPAESPPAPPVRPRYSRTAIWGLVCILVSLLPMLVIVPLGFFMHTTFAYSPSGNNMSAPLEQHVIVSTTRSPQRTSRENSLPPAETTTPEAETVRASEPMHVEARTGTWLKSALGFGVCFGILIGPLGLLGTILGWVAFAQIRRSNGVIVGKGLALFDGLFYPALLVLLLLIGLFFA